MLIQRHLLLHGQGQTSPALAKQTGIAAVLLHHLRAGAARLSQNVTTKQCKLKRWWRRREFLRGVLVDELAGGGFLIREFHPPVNLNAVSCTGWIDSPS